MLILRVYPLSAATILNSLKLHPFIPVPWNTCLIYSYFIIALIIELIGIIEVSES